MKKHILPLLAIVMGISSCDFLERTPNDKLVPENYFRNEQDFILFSNSFYDNLFDKEPYEKQSDIIFQKGNISDELLGGVRKGIRDVPQPVQGSLRHGSCERRVRNESSSAPKSGQAWRPQAHPPIGTPRMSRRATLCSPYRTSPSPQAQPATRTARSRGRRRTPIAESSRCRRAP